MKAMIMGPGGVQAGTINCNIPKPMELVIVLLWNISFAFWLKRYQCGQSYSPDKIMDYFGTDRPGVSAIR